MFNEQRRSRQAVESRKRLGVAEIVGDGKLFDEGLHEEQHVRRHDHQVFEEGREDSKDASEAPERRQGASIAGERKTPNREGLRATCRLCQQGRATD